jgi:uncharacterized LabA/DUF88 family protein
MKSTAILLDGGFLNKKLERILGHFPTSSEVRSFAEKCLKVSEEELFRVYYYDSPPYDGVATHPITKVQTNFAKTPVFNRNRILQQELCASDSFAVRKGEVKFGGWIIKQSAVKDIIKTNRAIAATDIIPDIGQKGVDMRIGLDVAWLASNRIVQRIILVTGDSDFIPAMKFARREGIQVVYVSMNHSSIKDGLIEHSDEHRKVVFP